MAANSKIEWTDHTWNPWIGCAAVSPACDHCYAEALMDKRRGRVKWGPKQPRARTGEHTWNDPIRWDRAAAKAGRTAKVFSLSLGDIWDKDVDPAWRRDAFDVMRRTPNLLWLLLSKRIGNCPEMAVDAGGLPPNVMLGATMVNQDEWDRDIGKLTGAGAGFGVKTFASVEPMLGAIDTRGNMPDWVICGGESGPGARPMHPAWVRSLRDQCAAAGVAFHFKQWGEWVHYPQIGATGWERTGEGFGRLSTGHFAESTPLFDGAPFPTEYPWWADNDPGPCMVRVGRARAGRLLDGREHNEFPAVRS